MMASGPKDLVYFREDYLVRPVSIHVWPHSEYELPFFQSLEVWASLLPDLDMGTRHRSVVVSVLSLPSEINCIIMRINSGPGVAVTRTPRDISEGLLSGSNSLAIQNGLPILLNITLQVELKVAVDIEEVVRRIPHSPDALLDLSLLSFGSDRSPDVEIVNMLSNDTCPITLQKIGVAVKGTSCKHPQSFDARSFLRLGAQTEHWRCPICGSPVHPEDLLRV